MQEQAREHFTYHTTWVFSIQRAQAAEQRYLEAQKHLSEARFETERLHDIVAQAVHLLDTSVNDAFAELKTASSAGVSKLHAFYNMDMFERQSESHLRSPQAIASMAA